MMDGNPDGPNDSFDSSRPRRRRAHIACNYCRVKKIRCNGGSPCTNCIDHGKDCQSTSRRKVRADRDSRAAPAMVRRIAMLENLLYNFKSSHSSPPQRPTQGSSHLEAITCTEPGLLGDGPASAAMTVLMPNAHSVSQLDSQFTLPASLSLDSPEQFSPLQRVLTLTSQEKAGSHHRSTEKDVLLLNNGLNTSQSELPQVVSSSKTISNASKHDEPVIAACDRIGLPPADSLSIQKSLDWASNTCSSDEDEEGSCIYSGETANSEYHGARSYLSICSGPAIHWMSSKTGSNGFAQSAYEFTRIITRSLKVEKPFARERMAEPSQAEAEEYIKAYFHDAQESCFGMIDQQSFEDRFRAQSTGATTDDDPAWYALRNAVFATGARIALSKRSSFQLASEVSWGLFSNAFSVHSELVYFKRTLMAIQALTVMAYFTDLTGNPCLEYIVSAIALRLACGKGLHRRPQQSWGINRYEQHYRNRTFWALYCIDKSSCNRSGRPSMLNDDEINCEWPSEDASTTRINLIYSTSVIKLSQLISLVMRKSSSVAVLQQSPQGLVNDVRELEREKKAFENFIQQYIPLEAPTCTASPTSGLDCRHTIHIRMLYYVLVASIHTIFTNPWSRGNLKATSEPSVKLQIENSTKIVVETSRNAIVAAQEIRTDAGTPTLLSFHGPFWALVNLALHVIEYPGEATVQSDLALLDMGAAHFARVEFATGFTNNLPRTIANLARTSVQRHRIMLSSQPDWNEGACVVEPGLEGIYSSQEQFDMSHIGQFAYQPGEDAIFFDYGLESWSAFLPTSELATSGSDLGQL